MFKLPPLNPLRAFEVAARLGSIKRAAAELNVTPGAVSRHVQFLEQYLQVTLFERRNREIELTQAGIEYMRALNAAFGRIDEATKRLTDRRKRRRLHIWSSITFTMRWLVPRLSSFHAQNPGLDVLFTTSLAPLDFVADHIDVAIRNRPLTGDGLTSELLFETDLIPVCSPRLLADRGPLAQPEALASYTFLHSSARGDDWAAWLGGAGVHTVDPSTGMVFETSSLAYQAAIEGLGVAIGQRALVADDLALGRLVEAFSRPLRGRAQFFLTEREQNAPTTHLARFRDWIVNAASAADRSVVGLHGPRVIADPNA